MIQTAQRNDPSILCSRLACVGNTRCAKLLREARRPRMAASIELGASPEGVQGVALKRANRHGLIAGATGTGKTVTLQVLAEAFAREGVNVFAADIKGDLSGV